MKEADLGDPRGQGLERLGELGTCSAESAAPQVQQTVPDRNLDPLLADDLAFKEVRNTDFCVNLLLFKSCPPTPRHQIKEMNTSRDKSLQGIQR